MRKLRLDPENLDVQSFNTAQASQRNVGTVFARQTEYYSCDAQCTTLQTLDVEITCNLQCTGGTTGGNSMHTACLDCYSQAQGCTQFEGCHTVVETCYPCG